MGRYYRYYLRTALFVLSLFCYERAEAALADRYNEQRPLVITCDWDMPPYEFLDENGRPAGYVVDLMDLILNQLGVPHVFEMRESFLSRDIFRQHHADVIIAPAELLRLYGSRVSSSVISRYHYKVLMRANVPEISSLGDQAFPDHCSAQGGKCRRVLVGATEDRLQYRGATTDGGDCRCGNWQVRLLYLG